MRKYGFCGITLLVAIVFTGCGDRDTEKDILENIPDVADEVESDTSSKEMPSSLSSEEPEGELFADKENLPEEMEEGEAAMVAYNNSDETIVETQTLPSVKTSAVILYQNSVIIHTASFCRLYGFIILP